MADEPPCDGQAEHGVLSCLMQHNELFASYPLNVDHFYLFNTRTVFEAIQRLDAVSSPFDFMSVTSELRKKGELDKVGGEAKGTGWPNKGAAYITDIFTVSFAPPGQFQELCKNLERMRKLRVIRAACMEGWKAANELNDPDEIYSKLDAAIIKPEKQTNGSVTRQAIADVQERIIARQFGTRIGTPTDLMPWDNALVGLIESRMYAIGARPGVGKTALMETIIRNIIRRGERVLAFQVDMSSSDMIARMACREAGVVFEDFDLGRCNPGELKRVENALKLINPDLIPVYDNQITIQEMGAILRNMLKRGPVAAVFVDVFGKIKIIERDKVEGYALASNAIRHYCNQYKVPWVINAHVNKEAEKTGRPLASQFRYCDQLFMDTDTCAMMWSPDDPRDLVDPKTLLHSRQKIHLSLDKNRGGGLGEIDLFFDRPLMKFFATEDKPY